MAACGDIARPSRGGRCGCWHATGPDVWPDGPVSGPTTTPTKGFASRGGPSGGQAEEAFSAAEAHALGSA